MASGRLGRESVQTLNVNKNAGRLGRVSVQYIYPNPGLVLSGGGPFNIDWGNDGSFDSAGDDVTARVRGRTARIGRGNESGRRFLPPRAGYASYTLDNRSGDYWPDNTSSPRSPNVKPGRLTRIRATWQGTTYNLFTGRVDDFLPREAATYLSQKGGVRASGPFADLVDKKLSTEAYFGKDTGFLIGVVLDGAGWPAGRRTLDPGVTTVPVWWEEETDAMTALTRLLNAEGPGALLYEDGAGSIIFKNRYFR